MIKSISCKKHLFHKESCESCKEADLEHEEKTFKVKQEKLEAIEKKRNEKE